jgi:ribulose 1,5-bisphosphate synthetase/thiazole synthase
MSHVAMDADWEVDLLIAGAGPAGMTAALSRLARGPRWALV